MGSGGGDDVYSSSTAVELYISVDQREEGIVVALSDAFSGVEFGANLSNQDISGSNLLAAKLFNTAALTF